MKVAASVRRVYYSRVEVYERLKEDVDTYFKVKKKTRWHYESRVKNLDSFCLKVETGRYPKASELEDFFGACLVVENSSEIEAAIELITEKYEVSYRRPKDNSYTHKAPSEFVFDDIRLYVKLKDDPSRRPKGIEGFVFEIQIKTFLQHAWAIATHDLIYKGDNLSWASSRIAYQVKAMLEHAELSIMESNKLSESGLVKKSNNEFNTQNEICSFLRSKWDSEFLPNDIIRLSGNIGEIVKMLRMNWGQAEELCEKSEYVGNSPVKNLSPYSAIVLSILSEHPKAVQSLKKRKKRLFLPKEVLSDLPKQFGDQLRSVSFDAQ